MTLLFFFPHEWKIHLLAGYTNLSRNNTFSFLSSKYLYFEQGYSSPWYFIDTMHKIFTMHLAYIAWFMSKPLDWEETLIKLASELTAGKRTIAKVFLGLIVSFRYLINLINRFIRYNLSNLRCARWMPCPNLICWEIWPSPSASLWRSPGPGKWKIMLFYC